MPLNPKPKYYVDGWGTNWYVMSRNHKTAARCNSSAMARKICKLLLEAESRNEDAVIAKRVRECRHVEIDCVEHVRLDGIDHYMAYSLLEELLP